MFVVIRRTVFSMQREVNMFSEVLYSGTSLWSCASVEKVVVCRFRSTQVKKAGGDDSRISTGGENVEQEQRRSGMDFCYQ